VGASIVVLVQNWVSTYVDRWQTLLGVVFVLVVLFAPDGIVGAWTRHVWDPLTRRLGAAKPVVAAFQALGALELAEGATALDALRPAGSKTRRLDPACATRGITPTPGSAAGQPRATAWAVVAGTSGLGVYLRSAPRVADPLTAWPDGTRLDVVGPDAQGDGLTWKQVRDPCGQLGWLPARYAAPTSAP
jgi:hypothetical protein